ncbi:hypothetical protein Y032_0424g1219 [Ancylostoma ceylanicum]|uniref:Uncharacterized protein n=1 Tax=Ancylostoma ceylanicum TaxID=53326 RepID=A0A016X232_9BILA|nr:hypothetical protein Y032_0424g1219 [Ancylostoma ceylanicum]
MKARNLCLLGTSLANAASKCLGSFLRFASSARQISNLIPLRQGIVPRTFFANEVNLMKRSSWEKHNSIDAPNYTLQDVHA